MADLNKQTSVTNAIKRITGKVMATDYTGDIFTLQQEMSTLQMHFGRLLSLHDNLIATADPADVDVYIDLYDEMETRFNTAMAKLNRLQAPATQDDDVSSSRTHHPTMMGLKLDRLSVPKFDGTLHNWLAFKDAFETLVHSQEFPEAYKLGKLREAVQGDAVSLVGGMYSGGYEEVWKALKARYDNPKQLAEIHVSRFIGLKQQPNETTSALLSIVDTVREAFRALTVMQLPVNQWDALAVPIITSKLPTTTQQQWGMSRTTNEIPTLNELLTFVEKRANSLTADALHWPSTAHASNQGARKGAQASRQSPRLIKSNLAAASPGSCEYCHDVTHSIGRCSVLLALPPADRFQKLKNSNLCFNCLRPGHATKTCTSTNCRTCNGKHHTILCRGGNVNSSAPPVKGIPSTQSTPMAQATPAVATSSLNQPPRNHL